MNRGCAGAAVDEPDCIRLRARGWLLAAVLKHKEAPSSLGKLKEGLHMGALRRGAGAWKIKGKQV